MSGDEECDEGGDNSDVGACTAMCKTAVCGDSLIQANVEQCDDGGENGAGKACNAMCELNVCGDGDKGPNEACDDGNQANDDACTNVCKQASCGDGFKQPGEECDDGDANDNTGACTLACKLPVCSDGFKQGAEECDDGNNVNTDGCTNACKLPVCGDGFKQGAEDCDDGNLINNDGCSSMCKSEFCFQFVNDGAENLLDNNWFDACVAAPGNNVRVRVYDVNNNLAYEATGPKVGVWNQNQITSTAGVNNQYLSSNHDRLISLNNGDKLMITGKNAANAGCGGSFGNGYGIVVYPANPNYYSNPKIMAMPYKQYVAPWVQVRSFAGWTQAHEISMNLNTMNTCNGPIAAYSGRFQFTVY